MVGGTIQTNDEFYGRILLGLFSLGLIVYSIFRFWNYSYSYSSYNIIYFKSRKIRKEIRKFENKITLVNHKYESVLAEKSKINILDNEVEKVVQTNLNIWAEQKEVYSQVIILYQKRLEQLQQHKDEIKILNFIINKLKNEPGTGRNPEKELKRVERIQNDIDKKINFNLSSEIKKLINGVDESNRRKALLNLKRRIEEVEKHL